ncbi:DEAD/DEAH box helicase [Yinghuangia sp. YIM S09857]|uniref:DEAD/DEAH box helicase n=1 Tax=Yinghuangia sp. YIM S09857 TaxID=3436929 RepID=UPI003F5312F1
MTDAVPGGGVIRGKQARAVIAQAVGLRDAAAELLDDHRRAWGVVTEALTPLRAELVLRELDVIPIGRLKDVTEGRLRLAALEAAGYDTVRRVHDAGHHVLRQIPGVGAQTADQAVAAAAQIVQALEDTVAVRIDVDHPEPRTTALVVALHTLVQAGPERRQAVDAAKRLRTRLAPLLDAAKPAAGRLRALVAGRDARARAYEAVAVLDAELREAERRGTGLLFAQTSVDLLRVPASEVEAWVDFEVRSPEYYNLLAEVSGRVGDHDAAQGFVPDDIASGVNAQRLDDRYLRVSLRGYQAFGARFALVQRRVILGDEMGLGKTVQAIAAMAHLAASGSTHHLVVCPASVLINWTREIGARSKLRAVPVHGPDRQAACAEWRESGGVAVTTYDVLHTLGAASGTSGASGTPVSMLVVDEAHYVKNSETRRARALDGWIEHADRVLFLTGTPMENRVEEFRSLVRRLQPGLLPDVGNARAAAGSKAFRRSVAPAYLRRNQEDVLPELPPLIEVDEWEEPTAGDLAAYRDAVAAGNFMAMRRAAYANPAASAKLRRLRELVAEASDNKLKVVVFSYFRDVLDAVEQALGDEVFGPISGGVPPARRQRTIDEFTVRSGHAVLLSQIQAGGVGLNMQAASVVVICEPQVKPTMEHQAVARAHRMGQVRTVQVHRLLAADTVDQRMLEILADKTRLFDAYARRSDVAEATPSAIDVSEPDIARRIVEAEQRRLAVSADRPGG